MSKLESRTISSLKANGKNFFDVRVKAPDPAGGTVYVLSVGILQWCDTFRSCRVLIPGDATGGDEARAKIYYRLSSQSDSKVFENTETFSLCRRPRVVYPPISVIPADDPAYDGSVYLSELSKALADALFKRMKDARLF